MVIRAGMNKRLVRMANREDPDKTAQKQSDLGLSCLSRTFCQVTGVQHFRTFTINLFFVANFILYQKFPS